MLIYNFNNLSAVSLWSEIKKLLKSDVNTIIFIYVLRTLNIENNDEYSFKYSESSLTLQNIIQVTKDKNIAVYESSKEVKLFIKQFIFINFINFIDSINLINLINFFTSVSKIQIIKFLTTTAQKTKNQIAKFLMTDNTISKQKSVSESLFQSDQWVKILKYHSNYNVFISNDLKQ